LHRICWAGDEILISAASLEPPELDSARAGLLTNTAATAALSRNGVVAFMNLNLNETSTDQGEKVCSR
jgi:hypothetical protein